MSRVPNADQRQTGQSPSAPVPSQGSDRDGWIRVDGWGSLPGVA